MSYIREAIDILTERGVSPTAQDVYARQLADETGVSNRPSYPRCRARCAPPSAAITAKEQRDLSKEGIAADIHVLPYTSGGESALGAASAARQLAAPLLQKPEEVPYVRSRLDMEMVLDPEMKTVLNAIFRCVDEQLPLNLTTLQQMLDDKAFGQIALAQAQNHGTPLQRQDIDMYLDRMQTAKPASEKGQADGR